MATLNLLLAADADDPAVLEERVDEALAGVLAADGPNLAPSGRRQTDASLVEVAWVDDEDPRNHVRLMLDSDIPARWLAVEAPDEGIREAVLSALKQDLPVLGYETLLQEVRSWRRGALTRLALTHDARLGQDLHELLASGLSDPDPVRREDAVMAAQLAGSKKDADLLQAALARERDDGLRGMLEHVIQQLAQRGR